MEQTKKLPIVGLDAAINASSYLSSFLHYSDFSAFPKEVHDGISQSLATLYEEITAYENWRNSAE